MDYVVEPKKLPSTMTEREALEWEIDCNEKRLSDVQEKLKSEKNAVLIAEWNNVINVYRKMIATTKKKIDVIDKTALIKATLPKDRPAPMGIQQTDVQTSVKKATATQQVQANTVNPLLVNELEREKTRREKVQKKSSTARPQGVHQSTTENPSPLQDQPLPDPPVTENK